MGAGWLNVQAPRRACPQLPARLPSPASCHCCPCPLISHSRLLARSPLPAQIAAAKKAAEAAKKALKAKQAACQAALAEAEAADGERKALGEQLAAARKAAKELEKQAGGGGEERVGGACAAWSMATWRVQSVSAHSSS